MCHSIVYFLYLPIMKADEKNQSWEERSIAEARRAASVLERKIKLLSKSPGMPSKLQAVGKAPPKNPGTRVAGSGKPSIRTANQHAHQANSFQGLHQIIQD